jgi:predicted dinucleotide-binding enzyme
MKIAVIGTGRMGTALAQTFSTLAGQQCQLLWGSRSAHRVQQLVKELNLNAAPVSTGEALEADIVLPALWHQDQLAWLPQHRERLQGKIVINITNPFNATFDDFTTDYNTSSAEELQKLVPEVRMVGAFKNTFWEVFKNPVCHGLPSDVYVTGDDTEAKQTVMNLLKPLPFRILDGGGLKSNRTIERMALFSRELSRRYGHYPYVSWRLWGSETNEPETGGECHSCFKFRLIAARR